MTPLDPDANPAGGPGPGPYIEIGLMVGRRKHLPALYSHLHAILSREMPARNMFVAILEGEQKLRFPYYVDERDTEDQLADYPKEGLTAFVMDEDRTVHLRLEPGILGTVDVIGELPVDWVGVPLRGRDGAVSGMLAIQSYRDGETFGDDDVRLLEFAAGQLSMAIQLQQFDRDLAINRIAALVDETVDLDELYEGVHGIVADLIPAARSCFIIAMVDAAAERFRPVFWRDSQDDWDAIDWPLDRGFAGYIYNVQKKPFIFERGRTKAPRDYQPIGAPPYYWLGVPLWNPREMIGVVIAQSYEMDNPVTREDMAMLSIVAPHIANAIGRSEFYARERKSLLP